MRRILLTFPAAALCLGAGAALLRDAPGTQPNQVVELAPGVYFRHGDLVGHGHCNNGFVVFKDFVLVIDGNFPSGAEACLADIRKVTDKPVRFVFDTHHHGDHAYGNPVWVKNGAVPVAHQNVAREMARLEPRRWRESMTREDVKATGLDVPVPPQITFPDRMVIDDGVRRVELLHFGTAHTRGDGFAYLPKERVLFTGDAVVNGPYNFMGDGNTESWVRVLDALRQLDVELVAPGHGPMGNRGLLDDQARYIGGLRASVTDGIARGDSVETMVASIAVPNDVLRYKGDFFEAQIRKIRSEMLGLELPLELEELGLEAGAPPPKEGWTPPRKVIFTGEPAQLPDLERVAPGVQVTLARTEAEVLAQVADADAVIGRISKPIIDAGKRLRWVHSISAGVEPYVGIGDDRTPGIDTLVGSGIVLTNGQRCYGPNIADQVFACLLSFSRQLKPSIEGRQGEGKEERQTGRTRWAAVDPGPRDEIELRGKTMTIIGVGGIGGQVARRARAFGMRVRGVDPDSAVRGEGVDALYAPENILEALRGAQALVVACPLTSATRNWIRKEHLDALADGAYVINVARGRIVSPEDLYEAARSGKLAGVALDVTEPEPLPDSSPLWTLDNVIITPHNAGQSDGSRRRGALLARENLRRFAAGEGLLNVVDKRKGY